MVSDHVCDPEVWLPEDAAKPLHVQVTPLQVVLKAETAGWEYATDPGVVVDQSLAPFQPTGHVLALKRHT